MQHRGTLGPSGTYEEVLGFNGFLHLASTTQRMHSPSEDTKSGKRNVTGCPCGPELSSGHFERRSEAEWLEWPTRASQHSRMGSSGMIRAPRQNRTGSTSQFKRPKEAEHRRSGKEPRRSCEGKWKGAGPLGTTTPPRKCWRWQWHRQRSRTGRANRQASNTMAMRRRHPTQPPASYDRLMK